MISAEELAAKFKTLTNPADFLCGACDLHFQVHVEGYCPFQSTLFRAMNDDDLLRWCSKMLSKVMQETK
jgi:hypothetical protein